MKIAIASGLVAAVTLGIVAFPAHAADTSSVRRVSEKFEDMAGFEWGLSQVTRLQVSGVLRGHDDRLFAPGAKVSRQETAVAVVRLMGAEAEAAALAETAVTDLLQGMPDAGLIAPWARNAVALLVAQGFVDGRAALGPEESITRLETAVLLVKVLGYEAGAQARTGVFLPFADSDRIPLSHVGYVATALAHNLISGFEDNTFRPEQGVKRVELAVMLGRADRQKVHRTKSEVQGTLKAADSAARTLTVTKPDGVELTAPLSDDASIFLGGQEATLADLQPGMKVDIKLNPNGMAVFIEAEAAEAPPASPVQGTTVTGEIVVLYAPTVSAPARVAVGSVTNGSFTLVTYDVPAAAPILVNGQAAQFGHLMVGDSVKLTLVNSVVTQCDVTR